MKARASVPVQRVLIPSFSDTRSQVNNLLSDYFRNEIDKAGAIDIRYARLWRTLQQVCQAGGKRLRPSLVMFAYAASGGSDFQSIMPIASAQELLHQSLLMHDDVIDREVMRHGQLNVIGHMDVVYEKLTTDHEHYASSAAILAGDLLITGAYQMVIDAELASDLKIKIMKYMSEAYYDVGAGELLDTESAMHAVQDSDVIKIATYKTASYSFVGPLLCGAALGNKATAMYLEKLRSFGKNLGIAYQLRDDVLGVFGDENITGKSVISDIREGKHTLLFQLAFANGSLSQISELNAVFGDMQLTPESAQRAAEIIRETGALDKTETTIRRFIIAARQALAWLELNPTLTAEAEKLINTVTRRTS
jgi:geranylgeranyl pyrophosphate synthase